MRAWPMRVAFAVIATIAVMTLIPCASSAQESRPPDGPGERLGCWQRDGDPKVLIRVEPARISFFRNGNLDLYRASYAKDKVIVSMGGLKAEYSASVSQGTLIVETSGEKETYRRLDVVPDELIARALELGKLEPDAEQIKAIQQELRSRAKLDQEVRTDPARMEEMESVDQGNTAWLVEIVGKHGWVDATRFGKEAASRAFLLVQHSGHLPLMMAALPKIEEDVKAKRVGPQDYALLCDRLKLKLGEKQRYGSQIGINNNGERIVLALEDPDNVDQRRKEIGLGPISEYLRNFRDENGGKDPRLEVD